MSGYVNREIRLPVHHEKYGPVSLRAKFEKLDGCTVKLTLGSPFPGLPSLSGTVSFSDLIALRSLIYDLWHDQGVDVYPGMPVAEVANG